MNKTILFLMAGLAAMLLSAALTPTGLQARPVELSPAGLVASSPSTIELQNVLRPQGPRRDPEGPDDIAYDDYDGGQFFYYTRETYWSRLRFTPTQDFVMRALRILIYNPNEIDDPEVSVKVYRENQNSHSFTDVVWEGEVDPVMDDWVTVEFEDSIDFAADEDFTILYGPAPGGDPDEGGGWCCMIDAGDPEEIRSYLYEGAQFPTRHLSWDPIEQAGVGNLLIRANGEYEGDVMDLALDELYAQDQDEVRQWGAVVGQGRTFVTNLYNARDDVSGYDLWFVITDDAGDTVYTYETVDVDGFAEGDELEIETDAWIPEETGRYIVTVSASLLEGEDVTPDNNKLGLEQIVVDPANELDQWWGYVDEEYVPEQAYLDPDGFFYGQLYYFPGGDTPFRLTNYRAMLRVPAAGVGLTFQVFSMDLTDNSLDGAYETQVAADETGDAVWVEIPIPDEQLIVMDDTHAIIVGYSVYNTPGNVNRQFPMRFDATPPITGARIADMPEVNIYSDDINNGHRAIDTGEWMFEIQVEPTAPHGAYLRVLPAPLDFGYGLPRDAPTTLATQFIGYGDQPVNVTAINRGDVATRLFSLEDTNFRVAAGETLEVNVTFNADTLIDFDNNFQVVSDAENFANGRYYWPIHASTMEAVLKADVDEIDFGDNLSTGTDYGVDVTFSNPALVQVSVSDIRLPQEYEDILTVAPDVFDILPGEQIVWRVTLHTQEIIDLNTEITLVNDSQNDPEMVFAVHAGVTGVSNGEHPVIPLGWSLAQNNPNPFNPTTTVEFTTLKGSVVDLAVYDMSGRRLLDVFHGYLPAGYHSAEINAMNIPAGIYLYRVAAGEFSAARKMVLMR